MTLSELFFCVKESGYVGDADFKEADHPRDEGGRFTETENGSNRHFDIKATKEQIENLQSVAIMQGAEKLSKDELKAIYKALPDGQNKIDGRKVKFVNSSFGKIVGHGNAEIKKIIPQLAEIFNCSIPLHDSNYVSQNQRADGSFHKVHNNFIGYHNYLGKIKDAGNEYYVRFTIQELNTKEKENQFHDVFVSDIELYKKSDILCNLSDNNRATIKISPYDSILADVFYVVNNKTFDNSLSGLFEMLKNRE